MQGKLDLHEARRLGNLGREALESNAIEEAAALFRQALDLWRGPVLVDLQAGPVLRLRLRHPGVPADDARQRIEADLRLGRHHELLSELSQLAGEHPLHENLHAQFMVALYRSGRLAQALDVYQQIRRAFNEELGLEPSPRLRGLQQAILATDPVLDVPAHVRSRLSLDLVGRTARRHRADSGVEMSVTTVARCARGGAR
jgi:SARP family transcriptional regulator, regulator of embCAB operon